MITHRCWRWPKHANSGSLQLQIWQFDNAPCLLWTNGWDPSHLNQGMKFTLCRQDYPLPPPINRGSVDDLRGEKIGSKVSQKTSLPPYPRYRFSSSASSSFFLRHRKPTPSPFLPPAPAWETTTTISGMETIISTISRRPNLLPLLSADFLFFLFQLQLLQPTPPPFPPPASGHPPPASHHRHARWSATLPLVLRLLHESSTVHKWTVDLGPDQFWPSPNSRARSGPAPKK